MSGVRVLYTKTCIWQLYSCICFYFPVAEIHILYVYSFFLFVCVLFLTEVTLLALLLQYLTRYSDLQMFYCVNHLLIDRRKSMTMFFRVKTVLLLHLLYTSVVLCPPGIMSETVISIDSNRHFVTLCYSCFALFVLAPVFLFICSSDLLVV